MIPGFCSTWPVFFGNGLHGIGLLVAVSDVSWLFGCIAISMVCSICTMKVKAAGVGTQGV